jgi:hypothetical protein
MDAVAYPQDQGADGAVEKAQGHLPALRIPAHPPGGGTHQPGLAWVGELLSVREFEPVLFLRPAMGGEEDAAAFDASPDASGFWLEEVE